MSRTVSPKPTTATVVTKIDPDTPFIRDLVRQIEQSHQVDTEFAIINLIRENQEESQKLRQARVSHNGTLHSENPVTFLQFTNLNKKYSVSKFLIDNLLIDPNEIINPRGETILHQLSQQEPSEEIIKKISRLLALGANPNIKNNSGNTPLHFACDICEDESTAVISQMLEYNADPFLKNKTGVTPLDNCRAFYSVTEQLIKGYADRELSVLRKLNADLISKLRAGTEVKEKIILDAAQKSLQFKAKISELTGRTLLLEEEIAKQKSKLDDAEREKTETASENLQLKLEKAKLVENHRKAIADQKAELTARHRKAMADQEVKLKAEYRKTIDSVSAKLTAKHQEAIDNLRAELTAQHEKAMADQEAELTAKHGEDIKTLKEKLEASHKEELAAKEDHIDTLRSKLDDLLPLPHVIGEKEKNLQRLTTENMTLHHYNIELGRANHALNLQLQQLTQELFLTEEKLKRACLKIGEQSIEPRHAIAPSQLASPFGHHHPVMTPQIPPHQMLTHAQEVGRQAPMRQRESSLARGLKSPLQHTTPLDGEQPPSPRALAKTAQRTSTPGKKGNRDQGSGRK